MKPPKNLETTKAVYVCENPLIRVNIPSRKYPAISNRLLPKISARKPQIRALDAIPKENL